MRWLAAFLLVASSEALTCDSPAADSSRIAVAGGSVTEILYFLGADNRIVATDTTSNFPAAASAFPSVGYVRNLSTEGLLSLDPTLILGEHDMGPPEVLSQVDRTGIEVVRVPEQHTAKGIVEKVRCIARVLNLELVAEKRIEEQLAPQLAALGEVASNTSRTPPKVAMLLGLRDGVPIAAGHNTSGDGVLQMAGAANVFADIDGWKPVSMESMAAANPDAIVIPRRGVDAAGGIDAILTHPAIRLTTAGQSRRIVSLDGMAMLGFGPRTLEAALQLAEALRPDPSSSADSAIRTGK